MKAFRFLFLILFASAAFGQDENPDVISPRRLLRVGCGYQSWSITDIARLSEVAFPVEVYYPIDRRKAVGLFLGGASATGLHMTDLSGLTDALVTGSYYLEDRNLLLSAGIGLPTGKRELTAGEFATSVGLGQSYFNYRVPVLGQGFSFSPGLTWAKPVNDQTVIGLGASYQLKGGYVPVDGMKTYRQGGELLLTGGVDYQTSEISAVSVDLTLTMYGKDVYDGEDMLKSGTKVMAAAQYKRYVGYDLIWLFGRFRSRGKSVIYLTGVDGKYKLQRDEFEYIARYRRRVDAKTAIAYSIEARYFFSTDEINQGYSAGAGIAPEKQVSPEMKLKGRLMVFRGRDYNVHMTKWLTGFEIGAEAEYAF
jgi:hypothetical protein